MDTRELPSPEPLERVLNTLSELKEGSYIKMIHRMEPALLFPILKNNGFDYLLRRGEGDEIRLYIFLRGDTAAREHIRGL